MENFKGYVYTIFSGLLLAAALVFTLLQWGSKSTFSLFGKPVENVVTFWIVLFSAVGGIVVLYLVRLFVRGVRLLHKVRSAERLAAAGKAGPKEAAKDAREDNPLSPR